MIIRKRSALPINAIVTAQGHTIPPAMGKEEYSISDNSYDTGVNIIEIGKTDSQNILNTLKLSPFIHGM